MGSYMADAQKMISEKLPMPNEYTPAWFGQYEIIQQNSTRWKVAVLIALVTIILLLYAASRNWLRTLIVPLTVRFSGRGNMVPMATGLQLVKGGDRGSDRAGGIGGRYRHRHAFISGQQQRGVQGRRAEEHRPGLAVVVASPGTQNGEGVHE
jgi:hypothetical protein